MLGGGSIFSAVTLGALARSGTPPSHFEKFGEVFLFACSANASEDEAEVIAAMRNESRGAQFVLDLAQLETIDPSRLGSLVAIARQANRDAVSLKLMNVRPGVEAFLRENNLLAVFAICSPQEAISLWCRSVRQSKSRFGTS